MRHTKVILLVFVIIAFLINPVSALSKVAPYDPIPNQYSANVGGYREFIATGHDCRIRQNGDIKEIELDIRSYEELDEFYFTIWRRNSGGTYNKIHSTVNIRNSLQHVSGYEYKYVFTNPLDNIQEGDFYGYRIKTTGDALYAYKKLNPYDDYNPDGTKFQTYSKYLSESLSEVPDGFDWENNADVHTDYIFVIECYMDDPYMIFIGNSIIAGFDDDESPPDLHYSFIEPQPQTDPTGTLEYKWSDLDGDKTYQNMGINGDYISGIDSRFIEDAVNLNPEYILIEGGVNDINTGQKDSGYVLDYWDSILGKVEANPQITPVILLILPFNNRISGQEYKLDTIDAVNDGLIDKAANDYPGSIVVDARDYVGFIDSDGYWRIDADKTCDDWLHYNRVGNQEIAQAIYDAMHDSTPSISIPLSPGWNLISAPLNLDTWELGQESIVGDPLNVTPENSLSSIYRYDTTSESFEMCRHHVDWGWDPATGSESFTALEPGKGYWVMAENDCTLTFTGTAPSDLDISLDTGWNCVGWYSTSEAELGEESLVIDPFNVTPDNSLESVYRYDTTLDLFEMSIHHNNWGWDPATGSESFTELEPGKGYWVMAENDCEWRHET